MNLHRLRGAAADVDLTQHKRLGPRLHEQKAAAFGFKEGLGGRVVRTLGAWDYAPNKFWYKLYSEILPRVLDVMRARGKRKASQVAGA